MNQKLDLWNSIVRDRKDIGAELANELSKRNLSEENAAFAIGCSKSTINNINNAKSKSDLDVIFRYAIYLGLDPFKTVFTQSFYDFYLFDKNIGKQVQDIIAVLSPQQKIHLFNALNSLVQMLQANN